MKFINPWISREAQPFALEQLIDKLRREGIQSEKVLNALSRIDRRAFIDVDKTNYAFDNHALPIKYGQTISQPYIVAIMTQELDTKPEHHVLEIGTGSGYQTMILSQLVKHVSTVERIPELMQETQAKFQYWKINNINFHCGDGYLGWSNPKQKFNRILVTAAAAAISEHWLDQLCDDGILIAPIGSRSLQELTKVQKKGSSYSSTYFGGCRFVPLITSV